MSIRFLKDFWNSGFETAEVENESEKPPLLTNYCDSTATVLSK
jgi:hypothetical protein